MSETFVFPWVPLAAVAAGVVAVAVVTRGASALVGVAVGEVNYRVGTGEFDAFVKRFR